MLRGPLFLGSFSAVCHIRHIRKPLAGVLLCCLVCQALSGVPWVGSYCIVLACQALKRPPGWGSTLLFRMSGACWTSLSIVQLPMLRGRGERGYSHGSTHKVILRSITLLPWLPGFPPQTFPTTVSPLTSLQSVSLCSQQ